MTASVAAPKAPPTLRKAMVALAVLGFATTLLTIGLALVPAEDEPNKMLAVAKVVGLTLALVLAGAIVYAVSSKK